ncbi:hypothetical protein LIER_19762 [Lithospermum erythrorhizon]|uniref:Retrovirus-related Pol polyprotein from transposon TNT 1-94-like beta-barrel domain-containing protein n=1 Tax=Lithospermum erythrorhizon TaxID=34254 RepID=A0AAV3QIZ4_LITER
MGANGRPKNMQINSVSYQEQKENEVDTPFGGYEGHADQGERVNLACWEDFAGNNAFNVNIVGKCVVSSSWIIHSGASTHVCSDASMFHSINNMSYATSVKLPDIVRIVKSGGIVKLNNTIDLFNCLFVPNFNYNLLSVSKLGKTAHIHVIFFANFCLLQDTKSNKVLVVGKENGELYILSAESFLSVVNFYSDICSRLFANPKHVVNTINKTASDSSL